MKLHVLGSSSSGNCYLLNNENEILILEAGIPFTKVLKEIDFQVCNVVGCIITHRHGDHAKYAKDYKNRGIRIYGNEEVVHSLGLGAVEITSKLPFLIGNFKIMPFNVVHDVPTFGYIINHPETGNIVFITDSAYSPYVFKNINHAIVEANYIHEMVIDRIRDGEIEPWRLSRLQESHMSLETCIALLKCNDLSKCANIVLIHLSNDNSDHIRVKREVEEAFHKPTHIASPGLVINLNYHDYKPNF